MKKTALLILAALMLCLCCTRPQRVVSKDTAPKVEVDSMAERIKATLAVYLKDSVDQVNYKGALDHATELAMIHGVTEDSMRTYYNANIEHIDSLVKSAFELIDSGKLREWWEKIDEKKLTNFYLHPSNLIDNEIQLHMAMVYMNNKFLDDKTAQERNIKMWMFSDAHCFILDELNNNEKVQYYHLFVLEKLAITYKYANDSINAIETAERFKAIYNSLNLDDSDYLNDLLDYVHNKNN